MGREYEPLVSFQQEAKKAESSAAAMGLRNFLELKAGPYRDSEDALVSAITMLRRAHSLWQEELSQSPHNARQQSGPGNAPPGRVMRTRMSCGLGTAGRKRRHCSLSAVGLDLAGERGSSKEPERTLRGLADRAMASCFSTQDRGLLDTLLRELDAPPERGTPTRRLLRDA